MNNLIGKVASVFFVIGLAGLIATPILHLLSNKGGALVSMFIGAIFSIIGVWIMIFSESNKK